MSNILTQEQIMQLKQELPLFSPLRRALLGNRLEDAENELKKFQNPLWQAEHDKHLLVRSAFLAFFARIFCVLFAFLFKTPDSLTYRALKTRCLATLIPKPAVNSAASTAKIPLPTAYPKSSNAPVKQKRTPEDTFNLAPIADLIFSYAERHQKHFDDYERSEADEQALYHDALTIAQTLWEQLFPNTDKPDGFQPNYPSQMIRLLEFMVRYAQDKGKIAQLFCADSKYDVFNQLDKQYPTEVLEPIGKKALDVECRYLFVFLLASRMVKAYTDDVLYQKSEQKNNTVHYHRLFVAETRDDAQPSKYIEILMRQFMDIPYINPARMHNVDKHYLEELGQSRYLSNIILGEAARKRVIEDTLVHHSEKKEAKQQAPVLHL